MLQAPRELSIGRDSTSQCVSAVTSPRYRYSPGVYLYRKNSLSMKQKPVTLANCFHAEQDISRLDVVQDSLVHETRAILELMGNRQRSAAGSPAHMHQLKAKLPLRTRQSDEVDRTSSTIEAGKLYTEASRIKVRTQTSQAKRAQEIEDTAEYKHWLNRHRAQHPTRKQKENRELNSSKQVNISVRLVGRRIASKPTEKNTNNVVRPAKKRSIAG